MSTEQLVKILYNPSSITSVDSTGDGILTENNANVQTAEAGGEAIFLLMSGLLHAKDHKAVFNGLTHLKRHLMMPIMLINRPVLLEQFNTLLKQLSSRFAGNMDIFQAAIQLISMFKEQIEARPQSQGTAIRGEWVELEKAIYLMSTWEGQLDYFWSEAN